MNGQLSRRELLVGACLKVGVIASCVLGILQHSVDVSQGFMDSIFMAFTTQSNIWAAAICLVFLCIDLVTRGRRGVPRWLTIVKMMATTSVLLTWIVFAVLLSPTVPISYLVSPSNVLLHNLTPMLALLDFVLFDRGYNPRKRHALFGLIIPLAYMVFFFAVYELSGRLPVPYFFLDYRTLGWLSIGANGIGVVYWMLILVGVVLGMGVGMLELKERCQTELLRCAVMVVAGMVGLSVVFGIVGVAL